MMVLFPIPVAFGILWRRGRELHLGDWVRFEGEDGNVRASRVWKGNARWIIPACLFPFAS